MPWCCKLYQCMAVDSIKSAPLCAQSAHRRQSSIFTHFCGLKHLTNYFFGGKKYNDMFLKSYLPDSLCVCPLAISVSSASPLAESRQTETLPDVLYLRSKSGTARVLYMSASNAFPVSGQMELTRSCLVIQVSCCKKRGEINLVAMVGLVE